MTIERQWEGSVDADLVTRAIVPGLTTTERAGVFAEIYARHGEAVIRRCARWGAAPQIVEDVCHETFAAAFADLAAGKPPREPAKLRGWLMGIAWHRFLATLPQRDRETDLSGDVADEDVETASRRRQAQVDRLLGVVVATLTERQQMIYRHAVVEGRVGSGLAPALGTSPEQAARLASEIIATVHQGFGALVLARDGRKYCPGLARILDDAQWDGANFTDLLRRRILRHMDNCNTCDNCGTCRGSRTRLVAPYAPVVIPLLIAARLGHRVAQTIQAVPAANVTTPRGRGPRRPRRLRLPRSGLGAAAAAAVVVVVLAAAAVAGVSLWPGGGGKKALTAADTVMPALAYVTTSSVVVRSGSGPAHVVATFPNATSSAGAQLAWSADGSELGWLAGGQIGLADAKGTDVHHWTCADCQGLAFQGDRLVTSDPTTTAAESPHLIVYSPAGAGPTNEAVSGIPQPQGFQATNMRFLVLSTGAPGTVLVDYGDAGGSDTGGSQSLYTVRANGHATILGTSDWHSLSDKINGSLSMGTPDADGGKVGFVGYFRGGGCGYVLTAYVVDTATGAVTIPTTPAGTPANGYDVAGLWFDRKGNPYASFTPNPSTCQTGGSTLRSVAPAIPIECEDVGGHWMKVAATDIRVAEASNGWEARLTGIISVTDPMNATLTATNGRSTITVPAVNAFGWAH